MPWREYCCSECECITEIEQPISEEIKPEVPCRECGKPAKKIISQCSFRLRGNFPSKNFKRGLDY
jgi:putative FmdB family regulatory protein